MSEDKFIELPECGLDELIGLVKFNTARKWVNSRLNMDITLKSVRGQESYVYIVTMSVNKFTPVSKKKLLEDQKHEGIYEEIVGGGRTIEDALSKLKIEIRNKGIA